MKTISVPGDIRQILPADAQDPTAKFAAEELWRYIRLITGADLAWAASDCGAESRKAPGSFLLVLRGNSEEDGFDIRVDARAKQVTIAGSNPRSLLFGVYDLLKRFFGIRWLSPGKEGETFRRLARVRIPAGALRRRALLKYRGFYVDTAQVSVNAGNVADVVDWMAKNYGNYLLVSVSFYDALRKPLVRAMKLRGLLLEAGHHGFNYFVDHGKLFPKHPEWFSMLNGRRNPGHLAFRMIHGSQLCGSSRGAMDAYADGLKRFLDRNPEVDVLGIIPNDGFGWCECPGCRKYCREDTFSPLRPHEARVKLAGGRYHHILREVARRLGRGYADRRFSFWGYGGAILPTPQVRDLPDNFLLTIALYERWYSHALDDPRARKIVGHLNPILVDILGQWREAFRGDISIYEYYAKYCWWSLPKWMPDLIRRDTRLFDRLNLQGVMSMIEPDTFHLYEPNHLSQLAMSWDRSLGVEEWLDDYAGAAFGPLARPAREGMRDVISMMKPFAALGPTYPRALTPRAESRSADLEERFGRLAAAGRRKRRIPSASVARLKTWSLSMNLTRQRFRLNALYWEMREAIEAKRYEEALRVLKEWRRVKKAWQAASLSAFGSGAMLSQPKFILGDTPMLRNAEDALEAAIRTARGGETGGDPGGAFGKLRYFAC